jgi:hypothetical protein
MAASFEELVESDIHHGVSRELMDKAGWHEFLVHALNRPLAFAIMHLAARLGRAVYLPPMGTFVNDAEIMREVLTDTAHFDSHSYGSLGVLVTQALGS